MEALSKKWILILLNALLLISFGLAIIFVPLDFLKKLIFIVGALIAFIGLILVFGAFNYAKESKSMVFWLFQGLFNLVIGAIVMFYPEASIKFLLILSGLWAIVLGVYQFSVGLLTQSEIRGRHWHKINGFAAIAIGLVLIFAPEIIVGFVVQVFGIILLLIGSGMLYFAFLLRRLGQIEVAQVEAIEDLPDKDFETIDEETTP
jgi:uncharacterized membrane protein HdeD (DUF308 family)